MEQFSYGGVPVPWTVSWSGEETAGFTIEPCAFANGRPAICQAVDPGKGKPSFGAPHMQRQRQAIAQGLCDLCGRPLHLKTKVSLSHARMRAGAEGPCIMQVEPLLHKECAGLSARHCPSLKRDLKAGTMFVRQVTRYRVQFALMSPVYVLEQTGIEITAVGHAKVELLGWIDRAPDWIGA